MKRFTNSLFLFMCLLILPSSLLAQRTITGTITDAETGESLIAVNIVVEGTTTGTSSDIEGKYTIALPEGSTALTFSYTGYGTQTITVGASNILDVRMAAGENLNEVLVIGYGEIKKEDATGAISTVSSKDFNQGALTSAQDLIAGKLAGVSITPSSDPGGGSGITIRGLSSLRASNSPLVVIDGVPIEQNNSGGSRNFLNLVNPNDIENITVLKDASAAAIYGSRASGGVVIITTKKGKGTDKFRLNYNGNVSVNSLTQNIDVLTADEYRALITERFGENSQEAAWLGDATTDWQSEIYQNAIGTDHNINFSGGVKGLPYRASIGYTDKEGVLKTEKFQRTTVNLNLNPSFFDNTLQINLSAKTMFENNRFADRGAIGSAVNFNPTLPVRSDDPLMQEAYGGYFAYINPDNNLPLSLAPANPAAMLEYRDDQFSVQRYVLNGSVDYRMPFLPELRANLSVGIDDYNSSGQVLVDSTVAYAKADTGTISDSWIDNTNKVLEFYLNYVKDLNKDTRLDIMAGYSWQHFFFNDTTFSRNLTGNQVFYEDGNPREYYLVSLYSRLNFTYKDLLLTFTLRRDGSSRFSETTRFGLFPSAALAYKIFENKEGFVNNLKLRLGYGVTGQQDIGNSFDDLYPYLPLYDRGTETARYQFGNQFFYTQRPQEYDLNIKWEETATYNVGVDFSLLDDKVSGSLDFYQKYTSDLINQIPVPAGSNFSNSIITNIGDMRNNGVELTLNATPISGEDFTWQIGANATYETNEITKLIANPNDTNYIGIETGGIAGIGNTIQIQSEGYPLNTFYAYQQLYGDDGAALEGEYTLGSDGNPQRFHSTNSNASWFFGINTRVTYKNFELSMSGRGKVGNYIYNNVIAEQTNYNRLRGNTDFLTNAHSRITEIGFEQPQLLSDFYIENGAFFRMDFITLAYSFSEKVGPVSNLRIFTTVNNAFVVTNYTGVDPEVGAIDGSVYPRSRSFLLGVTGSF